MENFEEEVKGKGKLIENWDAHSDSENSENSNSDGSGNESNEDEEEDLTISILNVIINNLSGKKDKNSEWLDDLKRYGETPETIGTSFPLYYYGGTGKRYYLEHILLMQKIIDLGGEIIGITGSVNKYRDSALTIALLNYQLDFAKFLIKNGADVEHKNYRGRTVGEVVGRKLLKEITEKMKDEAGLNNSGE